MPGPIREAIFVTFVLLGFPRKGATRLPSQINSVMARLVWLSHSIPVGFCCRVRPFNQPVFRLSRNLLLWA
jgi:hypothetical protein